MDKTRTKHELRPDGSYLIRDYDEAPGFCSLLPGIGGPNGVPMWCMYVNRGQAVVSFGVADKEHAIGEFLPATWAYQLAGVQGFRTFCKVNGRYYEPFQRDVRSADFSFERVMTIAHDRVAVEERNDILGLCFNVRYVSVVNRPVPALIRRLEFTNTSNEPRHIDALDGLPLILPAGFNDFVLKKMRHIMEAYAKVSVVAGNVPFFATKVQTHDEAEVVEVKDGSFYTAYLEHGGGFESIQPLVDPHVVFGGAGDLITPRRFIRDDAIDEDAQVWENRLPCALIPFKITLEPGESAVLHAVGGWAPDESMVGPFLDTLSSAGVFACMADESAALIDDVTRPGFTASANPVFDGYSRQNLLDNVLRGGVPVMLPSVDGDTPLHLYARRHGDLERDYNSFELAPNPLSDGAGNYRDICQNRRHDVWLYPGLIDQEIRMFLELLQADGYNPLGVTGYRWRTPDGADPMALCPGEENLACEDFLRIV